MGNGYRRSITLKKDAPENNRILYGFLNRYYEPDLPFRIYKYINKFANTSMDISDGLISDMHKLINMQNLSFEIDINKVPISNYLNLLGGKSTFKKIEIISDI